MENLHKPIALGFNSIGFPQMNIITVAGTNISLNAQAYLLYETPTTLLARQFNDSINDPNEKLKLLVHELNGCIVGPGLYQEWTNYIYAARNQKEQNLELCRSETNNMLFYRAIKQIRKDEQLLAWYSQSVEKELIQNPIFLNTCSANSNGLSSKSNESQCKRCLIDFEYPNILKSHLIFNLCTFTHKLSNFEPCEISTFQTYNKNETLKTKASSISTQQNSLTESQLNKLNSAFLPIFSKKVTEKEKIKLESISPASSSGTYSNPSSPLNESKRNVKQNESNRDDSQIKSEKINNSIENKTDLFDFRSIESIQRKEVSSNCVKDCAQEEESSKFVAKNNNNGLDWKITMLDGTQTVELNVSDEMGKHKKTHVCLFCGKIYNRKYGLKIHLRTHTGYKPLKCKVCSRPFSDPSNLNKHVRLHSQGDTPYRCPYCGKILVRKRDLDRHIISRHSGKKSESPNQFSASETCKTNADEETDSDNSNSDDNMNKNNYDSRNYNDMVNYLEHSNQNLIKTFLD